MLDLATLSTPPDQSELYFWADYVELLCMTDIDGEYSADRLASDCQFAEDFRSTSPAAQDGDFNDVADSLTGGDGDDEHLYGGIGYLSELEAGDPDFDTFEDPDAENEARRFDRAAEKTDNRYVWCQTVFGFLRSRERLLGANYPFVIDERRMTITRRPVDDDIRQYVFLLCCSLMRCMTRSSRQKLATLFEIVSFHALSALLPDRAEVDIYGTSRNYAPSRFTGTPFERITALARYLGGTVLVDKGEFHPNDRGDGGLDLVAWIPLGDSADGLPTGVPAFFAQCAARADWESKQHEASYDRWRQMLHLKSPPVNMTFIPHHFREPGGAWYKEKSVTSVLMDRRRILSALSSVGMPQAALLAAQSAWDVERDVV